MKLSPLALLLVLCLGSLVVAQSGFSDPIRDYEVRQTTVLSDIPAGAKSVKWWVSIPNEGRLQEVLDFRVLSAPGPIAIRRDKDRGNRFLFLEMKNPGATTLTVEIAFTLRRQPVHVTLAASSCGEINDSHRRLFAEELAIDAAHMSVTSDVLRIATEVCGGERNVVVQAQKLLHYVADNADHYSKDPSKPRCGVGDATNCLMNGGGCCTDLHSLFIALARARGIPARLQMGYRLLAKNVGREVDPGYRCWAEYFVPGFGWVPTDLVEADASEGLGRAFWFSGLTERRLWLNEGRDFRFEDSALKDPINTMIIGHAEIDGVAARVLPEGDAPAQMSRTIRFVEIGNERSSVVASASSSATVQPALVERR